MLIQLAWLLGLPSVVWAQSAASSGQVRYNSIEEAAQVVAQKAMAGGYVVSFNGVFYGPTDLILESGLRGGASFFDDRQAVRDEFMVRLERDRKQLRRTVRKRFFSKFGSTVEGTPATEEEAEDAATGSSQPKTSKNSLTPSKSLRSSE